MRHLPNSRAISQVGEWGWSIRRRLEPPTLHVLRLPRPHLIGMIEAALENGIAFLRGPAGYGKTIAASLAYERLRSMKCICGWVSLGAEEHSVQLFRQTIRAALVFAGIKIPSVSEKLLSDGDNPRAENAVLDALYTAKQRVAFFVDGIERISAQGTARCLSRLINEIPPNVRMVMTSRTRSLIDLGNLQLTGALLEIDSASLRFTDQEAEQLLAGLVDRPRLGEVVETLRGWPAAIQQARQSLQRAPGALTVTRLLVEGPDTLGHYIDEQVLAPLSDSNKEFLACAAELRTDSGELVDAARGRRDRHVIQMQLAELDPLIRMAPDLSCSFDAHPTIVARLRRLALVAESRPALHSRAAEWLNSRGDAPKAINHMVAAGDIAGAAQMLERTGLDILASDLGPPQLRSLFYLVPATAVTELPRARLVWISMLANDGRRNEARAEFDRLKFAPLAPEFGNRAQLDVEIQTLETYFQIIQDEFPDTRALDAMSQDADLIAAANPIEIYWRQQRGDFGRARCAIEELSGVTSRSGYRFSAACLHTYRGLVAFGLGDLEAAERAYNTASAMDPGVSLGTPSLMIDIPRAELFYERDSLGTATDLLARHDPDHECLEDLFDVYAIRHTIAARVLIARGEIEQAKQQLRNAAAAARSANLHARHAVLAATIVEVLLQAGRGADEARAAADLPQELSDIGPREILPWRLRDVLSLANARLQLAEGNPAQSLLISESLMQHCDAIGLVRGSIRARLLAAAASMRLADERGANYFLLEALRTAKKTGHSRLLLDERTLLAAVLTTFLKDPVSATVEPHLREWAAALVRRLDADQRNSVTALKTILSARERDVLIGLSQGQTNKMIALACGITGNTVKHHLRHVYSKLKVKRRVQAIEEARRLSLIP